MILFISASRLDLWPTVILAILKPTNKARGSHKCRKLSPSDSAGRTWPDLSRVRFRPALLCNAKGRRFHDRRPSLDYFPKLAFSRFARTNFTSAERSFKTSAPDF